MNYNDDLDAMIKATAETAKPVKVTDNRGKSSYRSSAPLEMQSPSDIELFEKIVGAKNAAGSAKEKHDSINSDNYESGPFNSTYKPLSAEQRERQEKLFQQYMDKKKLAEDLFGSLTRTQKATFHEFENDLDETGNAGIGWLILAGLGVMAIIILSIFGAFSDAVLPTVTAITLIGLSVFFGHKASVKAEEAFNAKWHPKA
jgi:hypothetical protein